MLMPKRFPLLMRGSIWASSFTQTRISMGCSDTAEKAFAVMPWTLPGTRSAVTTVTPVAKWLSAWRKSSEVGGLLAMSEVFDDTILRRDEQGVGKVFLLAETQPFASLRSARASLRFCASV